MHLQIRTVPQIATRGRRPPSATCFDGPRRGRGVVLLTFRRNGSRASGGRQAKMDAGDGLGARGSAGGTGVWEDFTVP